MSLTTIGRDMDWMNTRLWSIFITLCCLIGVLVDIAQTARDIDDTLMALEMQQHRIANSYDKLLGAQHGNDQVPDRMLRDLPLEQRDQAQESVPVD